MFVYHFVDPELRLQLLFVKKGAAENEGVDTETGDIGTSTHLH